ncbi:hypothetical protein AB1Y20_023123 [Prymnesium parvum]|uniref:Uncharacterized protein n=1 Tax=Prymnesium parvum TaxID=97485 RepID=A0AB34JFG5_PRYPA
MASSVASAKEMERWRRERELAKASKVDVGDTARKSFMAMKADIEQLEKFERKAHQLVERQEAKEHELVIDPIINVMGSTAGAGSGEFHTYRGYRAKEAARLADFERERREEAARLAWEKERDELAAMEAEKAAKRLAKRNKKKAKKKMKGSDGQASNAQKPEHGDEEDDGEDGDE